MPVAGNIVRELWIYLDANDVPLGGMVSPGDVTLKLFRDSGSGFTLVGGNAGTGIAVSWAAVAGQTGYYGIAYTPDTNGLYKLELLELNAGSGARRWTFTQEVVSAGSVFLPAFANAFCAESDVERWLQYVIDGTTNPNDLETAAFAESKAGVLMSLCGRLGYPVTPATVPNGSIIKTLLRDANAIGAALDYTVAQILGVSPSKTDRFDYFQQKWIEYVGGAQPGFVTETVGLIEKEIAGNLATLASNHILSGDTSAPASDGAPQDAGITLGMGSLF